MFNNLNNSNIKNFSSIYSQSVPIIKIIQNLNFSLVENVLITQKLKFLNFKVF